MKDITNSELVDKSLNEVNGTISYTFKEKQGIKLFFETSAQDKEAAAQKAKALIKAQPWGTVLYFQATAV